jgi:hypothetical protein
VRSAGAADPTFRCGEIFGVDGEELHPDLEYIALPAKTILFPMEFPASHFSRLLDICRRCGKDICRGFGKFR